MQSDAILSNVQLLLYVINILGILLGFVASFLIKNLFNRMRDVEKNVVTHREDTLQHYVHKDHLSEIKKDILDNLDRVEKNLIRTLNSAISNSNNNNSRGE